VSSEVEIGALAERVRELAARRLQGYEVETVPRPWGQSVYVRWESRGVKRALELQVAESEPLGIDVWATASKARKDRSLKLASLPSAADERALDEALAAAVDWAERWKVADFYESGSF
jgi:hypothetical protein